MVGENMNKDDIKKALECCRNGCPIGDCPYYGIKDCENNLFKDTIELITEQEKEIEQLKTNISQAQDQILADDEIVESMKTYERARQETARKILQELYNEALICTNEVVELTAFEIKQLANRYGIELK